MKRSWNCGSSTSAQPTRFRTAPGIETNRGQQGVVISAHRSTARRQQQLLDRVSTPDPCPVRADAHRLGAECTSGPTALRSVDLTDRNPPAPSISQCCVLSDRSAALQLQVYPPRGPTVDWSPSMLLPPLVLERYPRVSSMVPRILMVVFAPRHPGPLRTVIRRPTLPWLPLRTLLSAATSLDARGPTPGALFNVGLRPLVVSLPGTAFACAALPKLSGLGQATAPAPCHLAIQAGAYTGLGQRHPATPRARSPPLSASGISVWSKRVHCIPFLRCVSQKRGTGCEERRRGRSHQSLVASL